MLRSQGIFGRPLGSTDVIAGFLIWICLLANVILCISTICNIPICKKKHNSIIHNLSTGKRGAGGEVEGGSGVEYNDERELEEDGV